MSPSLTPQGVGAGEGEVKADDRRRNGCRSPIAHAARVSNEMTILGARIACLLVYVPGIPWLRTGVWLASIAGLALIFLQLL